MRKLQGSNLVTKDCFAMIFEMLTVEKKYINERENHFPTCTNYLNALRKARYQVERMNKTFTILRHIGFSDGFIAENTLPLSLAFIHALVKMARLMKKCFHEAMNVSP